MKPRFSFNDAVSAPFVLLRRRPLYLVVWGLMMMALVAAMYSLVLPMVANLPFEAGREAAVDAYLADAIKLQAATNGLTVIMYGVMLLTWTAAGRATLAPDTGDRFLFLRVGMDEVRVAVVIVGSSSAGTRPSSCWRCWARASAWRCGGRAGRRWRSA
jgi:hypothetical protein